jgi:hypothetical protein
MTDYPAQLKKIEAHSRRRVRACLGKQQKSKRTLFRKRVKRGVPRSQAAGAAFSPRRDWALANTFAVTRAYPVGGFGGELGQVIRSNQQLPHWFELSQWRRLV